MATNGNVSKKSRLSRRQKTALPVVAASPSVLEAARRSNVGLRTLHRWLEDDDFRRELERLHDEAAELARHELQGLMLRSVTAISESLKDPKPVDSPPRRQFRPGLCHQGRREPQAERTACIPRRSPAGLGCPTFRSQTLNVMRSQVRALRRKMALAYAQVVLDSLANELCNEWHAALAGHRPPPDSLAFVRRVAAAGLYLPTFVSVVRYLDRCRQQETVPEHPALLRVLLPWRPLPRSKFGPAPPPPSLSEASCQFPTIRSCQGMVDAIGCNRN